MKILGINKFIFLLILACFFSFFSFAQDFSRKDSISSNFKEYTALFREVVYAHLNKSKFAENEMLGFTAYAFNKYQQKLSLQTKNLYCVIHNNNNNTIQKQLIEVKNGIAIGSIKLDSTFAPGKYQLSLFTNWMLNFNEPNHFTTSFKVLPKEASAIFRQETKSKNLDIQILPESGHFLENTINNAGIIVKDKLGFGVGNLKGKIITEEGLLISDFTLNKLGIGRFSFVPEKEKKYQIKIDYYGLPISQDFRPKIYENGFIIKIGYTNNYCNVSIISNEETILRSKEKIFHLSVIGGKDIRTIPLQFKEKSYVNLKFLLKDLPTGVNIFTLFKDHKTPIAERLFFNYKNLKIHESNTTSIIKKDTIINALLSFSGVKDDSLNNVSISVLPENTKAYQKNSNIIAHTLIDPYINGPIENGGHYFNKITREKKYDLDNLLITQGWSSYDWNTIFYNKPKDSLLFDKGITIKITTKEEKSKNLVLHNISNSGTQFISLREEENSIYITDLYPTEKRLQFSKRNKKGKLSKVDLNVQYYPNKIPNFKLEPNLLYNKPNYFESERIVDINLFKRLNDVEELDEIFIDTELTRKKKLQSEASSFGRVIKVNDFDRKQTLANFINKQPSYFAFDNNILSEIDIRHRSGTRPAILLNGNLVTEARMFYFWLDAADYVVIDQLGWATSYSGGSNGTKIYQGVVKVYTNPKKYLTNKSTRITNYNIPIYFSEFKTFYRPKYSSYKDDFFKEYGVIDWLPKNKIDKNGNLTLKFWNGQKNDIKLFIEGVTQDGGFIFQEKIIKIK